MNDGDWDGEGRVEMGTYSFQLFLGGRIVAVLS